MNSSSLQNSPLTRYSVGARMLLDECGVTDSSINNGLVAGAGVAAPDNADVSAYGRAADAEQPHTSIQTNSDEGHDLHPATTLLDAPRCNSADGYDIDSIEEERKRLFLEEFPDAEYYQDTDCDRDKHIWYILDLQLHHLRCCRSPDEADLLRRAYRKCHYFKGDGSVGYWQNGMIWDAYDATTSILACSSYERRRDFILCGYHNHEGQSPSCGDRLLCRRCCYKLLAEPALAEFGNCFAADNECYFIVTSLSRERDDRKRIIFKDLTKSEMDQIKVTGLFEQGSLDNYGLNFESTDNIVEARIYWEMFAAAIHKFTGRKKPLSGAFGGPELSVRFLPLAVLPHANYVAWSAGLHSNDVRDLRCILREKMRSCRRITPGLYPKVAVYRIQSPEDLQAVIKYMFKPIGLADAYLLAARKLECEPTGMAKLNQQVNLFLENLLFVYHDVDRMIRYGFCSASHDEPIGVVTEERLKKREKDRERRVRIQEETAEIKKLFPEYMPHRRKKTKEEKWAEFSMRIEYRKFLETGERPNHIQNTTWREQPLP